MMKYKSYLIILLLLLWIFACASIPIQEKLYPGVIHNNSGVDVDLTIIDTSTERDLLLAGILLGNNENWEVALPAGTYTILATSSLGELIMDIKFPEMLEEIVGKWHLVITAEEV